MIDGNFKSSIYLKNGVETSAVTVTPILYVSNGTKYTLPSVQLDPAGMAIVDINSALQNLGIAPYATLSGYVEIDYNWPWDPICATIRNLDTAHSLIFNYGLRSTKPIQLPNQPAPAPGTNVVEGIWWKQEANVTGFIMLANTTSQPLSAEVQVNDTQGTSLEQQTIQISPHGMKMVNLGELGSAATTEGGIRITYSGNATDLLINGGLEDPNVGYSAGMPFTSAPAGSNSSDTTVAELGLMTGTADPMMRFPSGITFTPYTVLRNVSNKPLNATPTVWWMAGGAAQSFQLSAISLLPYQTHTLNLPALLVAAGLKDFTGSLNLVFAVQGNAGALLMAGGSVDQTNTYVFGITPHGISESGSKSLSYWSTGNGDDTMVTLWNPADEAQDFIFQLTFSGGHYGFPVHLEPRATSTFNVSEIAQSQIPDAEGNIVPAGVSEGGATLMGSSHAHNEHILVAMDAGTYNVRKATCEVYCQSCNGVTGFSMAANPFAVAVGGNTQQTFYETWNTGSQVNDNTLSSWSTSNSSVATVGTHGSGTPGLVAGVGAGSPTIAAQYLLDDPQYTSYWCEGSSWACPLYVTSGSAGAPGGVTPKITSVEPDLVVVGTTVPTLTIQGTGFGSSPTVSLPQGVTFTGGQASTNKQIILSNVSVSINGPIGPNSITVTASNQPSNPWPFTMDGPFYMTVVSDQLLKCSGCTTTVARYVTYQVKYFSNSSAGTTAIGENPVDSGWNCNQTNPGGSSTPCSQGAATDSSGQFTDEWSLAADGYTPAGCGENTDDHWLWCPTGRSIGHINGYIHTNAVSINGVVNPPNKFSPGTVINP
jgi:hypothetical protein